MSIADSYVDVACGECEQLSAYQVAVTLDVASHTTTINAIRIETGCEHVHNLPARVECRDVTKPPRTRKGTR